jgi:hypothetical protein
MLVSYEDVAAAPEKSMRALCAFLGFGYHPQLVAHIDGRAFGATRLIPIDPRVRAACDELMEQLNAVAASHLAREGA